MAKQKDLVSVRSEHFLIKNDKLRYQISIDLMKKPSFCGHAIHLLLGIGIAAFVRSEGSNVDASLPWPLFSLQLLM